MKKDVIDMIAPPLILNHFGSIRFEYNQFGRHGILMVIDLIRCNTSLKEVFLIGNEFDNEEDISSMSDVICNHPSLKEVSIVSCAGVNTRPNVFSLIPASAQLTSLSLAGNKIKTNGSTIISDFLASNPALQELSLSGNKLNTDDAISIAAALKTNTNLWKLDLKSNDDIDRIGHQALCKAVFDPESLNLLSSCNHACDISVSNCKIPSFHGSISKGTRAAAIKLKISPPGNDGEVNVSLMGDTPLELLHRVLFRVQVYPMKGDWSAIQECLDGMEFLESDSQNNNDDDSNENEEEESDDDSALRQLGLGEGITTKDLERIQKRDEQLNKTRSLSIMFNVMKDLVVPILFSV